jgi:hypothetical protein
MNIKVTRTDSNASTTLFAAAEADALTLLRDHVRAIDDSEDDLIKLYLDAAIDYMQELSDRLLGAHDVVVTLDLAEVNDYHGIVIPKCQAINDDLQISYRKKDNTFSNDVLSDQINSEDNEDYLADFEYIWNRDRYPALINLRNLSGEIKESSKFNEDFVKLTFTAGTALSALPRQYKQAALLLVGHYYNMREAENIGGITTELKEGVRRLIQSVRQF